MSYISDWGRVQGTTGTPSTGTKTHYVATSAIMTVYSTASVGFVNYLNSCTPNPGFTQGSTTSRTWADPTVCVGSGTYNLGDPQTLGTTSTAIGYNDGTGTFRTGARLTIYSPGSSGYPTSYTETWLTW